MHSNAMLVDEKAATTVGRAGPKNIRVNIAASVASCGFRSSNEEGTAAASDIILCGTGSARAGA